MICDICLCPRALSSFESFHSQNLLPLSSVHDKPQQFLLSMSSMIPDPLSSLDISNSYRVPFIVHILVLVSPFFTLHLAYLISEANPADQSIHPTSQNWGCLYVYIGLVQLPDELSLSGEILHEVCSPCPSLPFWLPNVNHIPLSPASLFLTYLSKL